MDRTGSRFAYQLATFAWKSISCIFSHVFYRKTELADLFEISIAAAPDDTFHDPTSFYGITHNSFLSQNHFKIQALDFNVCLPCICCNTGIFIRLVLEGWNIWKSRLYASEFSSSRSDRFDNRDHGNKFCRLSFLICSCSEYLFLGR